MTRPGSCDQPRRVRRLLRCYPRSWRVRYGEEFTELLLAEFAERPRNWHRTANVIGCGLLARATRLALTSHELPPAEQARAALATAGCCLAGFGALGLAMLAQLATGWQWAAPRSASTAGGTLAMSVAGGVLVLLALAAAAPVAWRAALARTQRPDRRLRRAAGLAAGCAAILIIGARHFQNSWPGTGGTGAEHALVPAGVAAFGWAVTLSVTSFWVHPALLSGFPPAELAWMGASPLAAAGLITALARMARGVVLPAALLRYLALLAQAASATAAVFLAGAASWVLGHGAGETGLFRPGLVNVAELAAMALILVVVLRAGFGLRRARLALAGIDRHRRD
jgi:hypothetical protein